LSLSCPAKLNRRLGDDRVTVSLPKQEDEFLAFANCLTDSERFAKELQRLQLLFSEPPSLNAAPVGDNDARFSIDADCDESKRIRIRLADRYGAGRSWIITCWEETESAQSVSSYRNLPQADGIRVELENSVGASVTIIARWVRGRYLHVSREVYFGSGDIHYDLPSGACRWRIHGKSLPFVIPTLPIEASSHVSSTREPEFTRTATYPSDFLIPALAAYDSSHGILIASGDRSVRDLSRCYDLAFRADSRLNSVDILELGYRTFVGVQDAYLTPRVTSSVPLRDSVIIEPFTLVNVGQGATSSHALTSSVVRRLGELSRTFWFHPKPPKQIPEGSCLALEQWHKSTLDLETTLRSVTGLWDAQFNEVMLVDSKLGATGYGGIGAMDIGGKGIATESRNYLAHLNAKHLPSLQYSKWNSVDRGGIHHKHVAGWVIHESNERDELQLDLRNPQCSAWILRKHVHDLRNVPELTGYSFPQVKLNTAPSTTGKPRVVSNAQASALLQLAIADFCYAERPDFLSNVVGMPCVAVPASAGAYSPPGLESTEVQALLAAEIFGVNIWQLPEAKSLAQFALQTTEHTRGHMLEPNLSKYAGFNAFAENLSQLRERGGSALWILPGNKSDQPRSVANEDGPWIAAIPRDWSSTSYIWLAFPGIEGSVRISVYNDVSVDWAGGSWTGKLPRGIWSIEHPDPSSIAKGDLVLLKRTPLKPPASSVGSPS
jgi:hypothetical protein